MDTKKYIIEIPDNTAWLQWVKVSDKDGHVCFDFKDPEDLTPYTEPDIDAIRNEAYEKGVQDTKQHWVDAPRSCAYQLGYENGLKAAWDAARKIVHLQWDGAWAGVDEVEKWFDTYTASEAIEKIRQHEQEQEEQKQEKLFTVEGVMRQYLDTFCKCRICSDCPLYTPEFTCGRGNHFCTNRPVSDEEVRRAYAKVLKNMKE